MYVMMYVCIMYVALCMYYNYNYNLQHTIRHPPSALKSQICIYIKKKWINYNYNYKFHTLYAVLKIKLLIIIYYIMVGLVFIYYLNCHCHYCSCC
jgi:hypothetical protein